MGFVAVKCPNCGAEVNLDESREFGFCTYCGTKVVRDKIVVEHRGQVSVDGISTLNTVLDRANIYLDNGDFENAKDYYNKALDIQPRCSKADWGLLLCKEQAKDNEQLISSLISGTNYLYKKLEVSPEYKNALQFADPDERKEFLAFAKRLEASREEKRHHEADESKSDWKMIGIVLFVSLLLLGVIMLLIMLLIVFR